MVSPVGWSLVWLGVLMALFVAAFLWSAREDRRAWDRMRALAAADRRAGTPQAGPARAEVERDRTRAPSSPSTPVSAAAASPAAADTGLHPARRHVHG